MLPPAEGYNSPLSPTAKVNLLPQVVMANGAAVIYCPERMVAGYIEGLRTAALDAIARTGNVVLQLQSVDKIDSTGLGLLASLCVSARRRTGDVVLVAPSREVAEVLRITMLGHLFKVYPTVHDAVSSLRQ